MYQLSPPGPTAPPLKFRASILPESAGEPLRLDQRCCPESRKGSPKIRCSRSLIEQSNSTGCVDASPLALRRYIPPPRPTATLISCHAWGFQPNIGTWHVHTRLLGIPTAPPFLITISSEIQSLCPITGLRQESHRLHTRVKAEASAYAWAPTIAGRRNKDF